MLCLFGGWVFSLAVVFVPFFPRYGGKEMVGCGAVNDLFSLLNGPE